MQTMPAERKRRVIIMTPRELIHEIENKENNLNNFFLCLPKLKKLASKHPQVLVGLSIDSGEFEADGITAPITEGGDIDEAQKIKVRQGDPTPAEPFVFIPD